MKNNLSEFNEIEKRAILNFVKMLADQNQAGFSSDADDDQLPDPVAQAKAVAERRRLGRSGRVLVDVDDDAKSIRAGIQEWRNRTGRTKKSITSQNDN